MASGGPDRPALWQAEFRHHRPLIERIIAQTERCVLQCGHKLGLTAGRRGLILASASQTLRGRGKNPNPELTTTRLSRRVKTAPAKAASSGALGVAVILPARPNGFSGL
jgi:hypothetical protein